MENAFSFVNSSAHSMQGGDSRYNRLAQAQMFRDANPDLELEVKTRKVTDKLSESLNIVANEPSLAFFRIQEHVRKCLPQLAETKHEVQDIQESVKGACFDAEYAVNAVKGMHQSSDHFSNIQDLLKNSMFLKQQIDYEQARRSNPVAASPTAKHRDKNKADEEMDSMVQT
ncbi:BORC8-like protein [Mya arenaria]|uniref:BORC8-like protein n=1 Tax=Mya arenaria TaxID=6604 RepID=A0ABY7DPR9_MYAAR|nr:BLOC-1-related complex subunit 8-like [Mya arenaria]WAQ99399.1 BORC8-like protein [Mya arenaria]